ncbi:MAG: hypothetical protein KatS3mg119_2225 [Rhodothalassiaceae bacterium]|nr:MAG: hypothetical protein KatS3mg119_2225 [Rhodothalassiaceae bacterium]
MAEARRRLDALLDSLLAREGGYVAHAADRGGPTKYGITRATLSAWRGRPVGPDEVARLEADEARAIYRARFFAEPGIDRLPSALQEVMLDAAVHMGRVRAIRLLQRLLAAAAGDVGGIDGIIGPRTIAAAGRLAARLGPRAAALLLLLRALDLERLIAADPAQGVFARGWQNRLVALLPQEAVDAAAALAIATRIGS